MHRTVPASVHPASIGTPGQPWGPADVAHWRATRVRQRSYRDDVLASVERLGDRFDVREYGRLDYAPQAYPLYALRNRDWDEARPCALVTGGVHGYETSGVHGALGFLDSLDGDFDGRINLLVVPCVSPWGYEHVQRWNPDALDPNRSFRAGSPVGESAALMRLVAPVRDRVLVHVDLHETTDSDEGEFRPALAARDGKAFEPGSVPDGFYLVDDTEAPAPEFQDAIIQAVSRVTHIAPPDEAGRIIGSPVVSPGVIRYPFAPLGLCAGVTGARFRTTTEVYPDSPRATPDQCNAAQVAAVNAGIEFALAHG